MRYYRTIETHWAENVHAKALILITPGGSSFILKRGTPFKLNHAEYALLGTLDR